jgi:hypothetical protein
LCDLFALDHTAHTSNAARQGRATHAVIFERAVGERHPIGNDFADLFCIYTDFVLRMCICTQAQGNATDCADPPSNTIVYRCWQAGSSAPIHAPTLVAHPVKSCFHNYHTHARCRPLGFPRHARPLPLSRISPAPLIIHNRLRRDMFRGREYRIHDPK